MKMQRAFVGLLALSILMAIPTAKADGAEKCTWVRSDPIYGQPWDTLQGLCEVTISGTNFEAVLYDEKNVDWARFKIAGSIRGSHLAVKVETENSDVGIDDFTGTLKMSPLHEKVVVLDDGYNMIGIKFEAN